jgi:hypothetical protein
MRLAARFFVVEAKKVQRVSWIIHDLVDKILSSMGSPQKTDYKAR